MKPISTAIYTFEELIENNCLYLDKTQYFYKLVTAPKSQFFISRPRRFGKSLAVSTFEAIFQGRRDLFKGLYIDKMDYDWKVYPIIHLDFANMDITTLESLEESLKKALGECAASYDVDIQGKTCPLLFSDLIQKLNKKTGQGVVILVDEYDKPLTEHINNAKKVESFRNFIDPFFQMIKGSERLERFVFITGVTKFSKVSIFSKLNNLDDYTTNSEYACMFGYTQEEFERYFSEYIDKALLEGAFDNSGKKLDRVGLIDEIKKWYDGFRFSSDSETVYNPVSVGQFFINNCEFSNFWFATGTPTLLLNVLQKNKMTLMDLSDATLSDSSFGDFNVAELAQSKVPEEKFLQLLFQTGYLTIDSQVFFGPTRMYKLRFPNFEVKNSFERNLLSVYSEGAVSADSIVSRITKAAFEGKTENIISSLKEVFYNIPYSIQIQEEKYYQSIVFVIFSLCGMEMQAEVVTNIGRIDGVLETKDHLYIIEFKLNKSSAVALEQIDQKKYAEKYFELAKIEQKQIHLLGINFSFDKKDRNITDWKEILV